jgi:hypothetical protein
MQRRELLKMIAVLTGGSVVGAELFLVGCKNKTTGIFSDGDIAFFDEVAETIIPRTDTPGAKDAATGKFIALYASDCYDEASRKILTEGIGKLNEASTKKYGGAFLKISSAQRQELLTITDNEAREYAKSGSDGKNEKPPHYFTLMKQLTLLGFFTSKPGVTQVLRYNPVPGKYEGCIDYKKGEAAWTW